MTGPAEPQQPWDAPITALAMRVRELRTQLQRAGITGDVDLALEVRTLSEAVAALATERRRQRPEVPRWDQLTGPELAAAMSDLGGWVDGTLLAEFPETVPGTSGRPLGCWRSHRAVVWELSALHGQWLLIHAGDQADLAGLLDWLDRWRPRAAARIGQAMEGCTRNSCQAGGTPLAGERPRVA